MSNESHENPPLPCDDLSRAEYSDDGVDLTLIRWMLSLTPAQRLQVLQQNVRSIEKLHGRLSNR